MTRQSFGSSITSSLGYGAKKKYLRGGITGYCFRSSELGVVAGAPHSNGLAVRALRPLCARGGQCGRGHSFEGTVVDCPTGSCQARCKSRGCVGRGGGGEGMDGLCGRRTPLFGIDDGGMENRCKTREMAQNSHGGARSRSWPYG